MEMPSVTNASILDLSVELQVRFFYALGDIGGTFDDIFHLAVANTKIWTVYKSFRDKIDCHMVVRDYSSRRPDTANFRDLIEPVRNLRLRCLMATFLQ